MNIDLKNALEDLEKEKDINKEVILEAIGKSLVSAFDKQYKSSNNVHVDIDYENYEFHIIAEKEIVPTEEDVMDPAIEIALDEARTVKEDAQVGEYVSVEVISDDFGRMAAQAARNVITQKIREEERNVVFNQFHAKEKDIVTGIIHRRIVSPVSAKQKAEMKAKGLPVKDYSISWSVNLGSADAILTEKEMVPGEKYEIGDRMKFFVLKVENTPKGPRIVVSRTHPDLVKCLFESEVTEIKDKTVEIMSIAREAGSRTKMAVCSHNDNVDPVGACVGVNGARVNAIVRELKGEKIDIITWDENPGNLIRNSLSPAQIVNVFADPEEKTANVVVPDNQLSLAIGKVGQNARLAAKLTNYKIDIKSETQAKDAYGFRIEDYLDDEEYCEDGEYFEEETAEAQSDAQETGAEE